MSNLGIEPVTDVVGAGHDDDQVERFVLVEDDVQAGPDLARHVPRLLVRQRVHHLLRRPTRVADPLNRGLLVFNK